MYVHVPHTPCRQNENLQAAMNALAEYKQKQRSSYQFEVPINTEPLVIPHNILLLILHDIFCCKVEKQYELLPLREKAVPDKQGGLTVK